MTDLAAVRTEVQAAVEEIDSGNPATARQILTVLLDTLAAEKDASNG